MKNIQFAVRVNDETKKEELRWLVKDLAMRLKITAPDVILRALKHFKKSL